MIAYDSVISERSETRVNPGKIFRKKERSIMSKIMMPIMIIVLAQVIIFCAVMISGGSLTYIYNNSYQVLSEKIHSRSSSIDSEFSSVGSELKGSINIINSTVSGNLLSQARAASDIKNDTAFGDVIISSVSGEIADLVNNGKPTGAFVILDNKDARGDGRYSGIYIQENNGKPEMTVGDIMYLPQKVGVAADYETGFLLDENDPAQKFYFDPLTKAINSDGREMGIGYWSMMHKSPVSGKDVVTYSEPLIAADGTVYGIIGVEISADRLRTLLTTGGYADDASVTYMLAEQNDNGGYDIIIKNDDNNYFESENVTLSGEEIYAGIFRLNSFDNPDETLYGGKSEVTIDVNGNPDYARSWIVFAFIDEGSLFRISSILFNNAMTALLISTLFGILAVLIIGRLVTQPIASVVKELEKLDPTKVVWFEKTNIREIDKLTDSIKALSDGILASASKLSDILSVLDISIGAFEYDENSSTAFCTEGFFEIMDWTEFTYTDGYVDKDFLERKFGEMMIIDGEGDNVLYRITLKKDADIRYVKMTRHSERGRTLGVVEDVTKETLQKKQLEYERDYDLLTGILNRRAFKREVSGLFESESVDLRVSAIMMLDLDNLKYINDTYGHDYGDEYIRKSAEILRKYERYGGIVARMSGDEFYVFLSGYDSKDEIREIISEVRGIFNLTEIQMPDGTRLRLRASVGISWYPDDAEDFEELLRYADFAMYTVKHSVKGDVSEFDREKFEKDSILLSGKEELNNLIENELVRYALQPIIDAKTGEIFAFEALMRPQSETLRTPFDVIRVARQQAKVYQIEKLTWHKSMQAFIEQEKAGNIPSHARLFLNSFSSQILTDDDFNEYEEKYSDHLSRIVMEVLESDELDEGYARRKSEYVKNWGGIIALDDFGTGYNGDYALVLLNPDLVKIDMNMVRGIDENENKQELITNLISYAKRQNIKILAEGVQTREELGKLQEFGVDYIQGNLIALPQFEPAPIPDAVKQMVVESMRKIADS